MENAGSPPVWGRAENSDSGYEGLEYERGTSRLTIYCPKKATANAALISRTKFPERFPFSI
jgi:hypothetical protein